MSGRNNAGRNWCRGVCGPVLLTVPISAFSEAKYRLERTANTLTNSNVSNPNRPYPTPLSQVVCPAGLIQLELGDLVTHEAYLTPEFPKPSPNSPPVSPRKQPVAERPAREVCACEC